MIRTVVCEKEGCTGNSFQLSNREQELTIQCVTCSGTYSYEYNGRGFTLLSDCSACNSETFKIFKDTESELIYAKCIKCGNPPERVCIDTDGIQISYNEKLLSEVKDIVSGVEQRIMYLEDKVEALENGQVLSETSLAYITKFLTERN